MICNIVGPISYKRVREFSEFLNNNLQDILEAQTLTVHIASQGGDEGCGRALAGMIKDLQSANVKVITTGYGDVHSSAVIVFAAGSERLLSHAATIMVHESEAEVNGNASKIKKTAKQMDSDEKFWCDLLQQYTGTDSKVWQKLHEDETYLRPEDCLKLNLATKII